MRRSGFSLTELLIAVAVMAVIAVIGATTYVHQLPRGRDQKRMADLVRIQSALEKFRADTGQYKTAGQIPSLVPNYLDEWPVDPVPGNNYLYTVSCNSTYRNLCNRQINCQDNTCCACELSVRLENGTLYEVCNAQ